MGLEEAYLRAAAIIGPGRAESPEVALEVELLRLAWKPQNVRVIILAESHVWTTEAETRSRVRQPDGVETGFARFVYCLGYGEPLLVLPEVLPNDGTWQYWRLFHDTVRAPDDAYRALQKGGQPHLKARAVAKLALLREMKCAGIWLVDACVTALYQPGGTRTASGRAYREILEACWKAHVCELTTQCSPSAILIVGKDMNSAIGHAVRQVGLMMLPAAAARFWVRELWSLSAASSALALLSGFLGLLLSYYLDFPSGPSIVLVAGVAYLCSVLFGPRDSLRELYSAEIINTAQSG